MVVLQVTALLLVTSHYILHEVLAASRGKRNDCDPRSNSPDSKCYSGDLIHTSIADCEAQRSSGLLSFLSTCSPTDGGIDAIRVIGSPDTRSGANCVPDTSRPVVCGSSGSGTRCVCDGYPSSSISTFDYFKQLLDNKCRCRYWPVENCSGRCEEIWPHTLGLCSEWKDCLEGCHSAQDTEVDQNTDVESFCGDQSCGLSEDTSTCPLDCCPVLNPGQCALDVQKNTCLPTCC
jgi:hypothetical protein